jgi:hypothetical protein
MVYKVFRRPSIDLDAKGKTWQHRPAHQIREGATIPDLGTVVKVITDNSMTSISSSSGKSLTVGSDDIIYSFQ